MVRLLLPLRLTVVFLGIAILQPHVALSQTESERLWMAGRYDGNRIIVYFDAVQFNGTLPATPKNMVPAAGHFFEAVELSPEFIAPLQKTLTSEHFALGDHYDLILEENHVATVSLTTLIGCETDEGVGNDSYIGALAPSPDILTFRYCSALGTFRYRNQGAEAYGGYGWSAISAA